MKVAGGTYCMLNTIGVCSQVLREWPIIGACRNVDIGRLGGEDWMGREGCYDQTACRHFLPLNYFGPTDIYKLFETILILVST